MVIFQNLVIMSVFTLLTIPCDSASRSGVNNLACNISTITGKGTVDNNASLNNEGSVCLLSAVCN